MLQDAGLEIVEDEKSPSVIIVTGNLEYLAKGIGQNYNNQTVVQREKEESHADLFNRAVLKEEGDFFIFLGEDFDFAHPGVLTELVEFMQEPRLVGFGGIYADINVMEGGRFICNRHNPSYDIKLLKQRAVLNFPFLLSCRYGLPKFTKGLDVLSLWDGMIQCMASCPMYHLPRPMFTMKNTLANVQIEHEIALINETHYS